LGVSRRCGKVHPRREKEIIHDQEVAVQSKILVNPELTPIDQGSQRGTVLLTRDNSSPIHDSKLPFNNGFGNHNL
jgi:hypothetical protein